MITTQELHRRLPWKKAVGKSCSVPSIPAAWRHQTTIPQQPIRLSRRFPWFPRNRSPVATSSQELAGSVSPRWWPIPLRPSSGAHWKLGVNAKSRRQNSLFRSSQRKRASDPGIAKLDLGSLDAIRSVWTDWFCGLISSGLAGSILMATTSKPRRSLIPRLIALTPVPFTLRRLRTGHAPPVALDSWSGWSPPALLAGRERC